MLAPFNRSTEAYIRHLQIPVPAYGLLTQRSAI